jgi:hypothetical protein
MARLTLAVVCCLFSVGFVFAAEPWLTADVYGTVQVVVAADAHANDRLAAEEFAKYWEAATGHAVPVSNTPGDGVTVWIGMGGLPETLSGQVDLLALGADGVRIFTAANTLVLTGAGDRGPLNAVYEFFDRYIGVRWLTDEVTFVPQPPSASVPEDAKPWERTTPAAIPAIDYSYTPVFEYRWTRQANGAASEDFGRKQRMTQDPGFGLWVHTIYELLPPDEYFADHPEYYSMVNGQRVAPVGIEGDFWGDDDLRAKYHHLFGQLCFTNPEVAEVVAENVLKRIRANPKPRIWSVSQEDQDGYCECDVCKAANKAEGSPMGSMLPFVNRVAEIVEQEYPDHFIETLAYTWSRHVPKTVRPRDNVIIRLCSIECDFARPLNDPSAPENALFARDIQNWAKIAKQLYIWDYVINFSHYQMPHPNLNVLQENMQFFAENKVRGMFEQGLGAPTVALGYIRPYLLAKLLWNPDIDYQATKDEFIDLFYRESSPYMREYFDLIHEAPLKANWMLSTFSTPGWFDNELVKEARDVLDLAAEAAGSEEVLRRVEFEQLTVEYAAMVGAPKTSIEGQKFIVEWPQSLSVPEYMTEARAFGVSEWAERRGLDTLGDYLKTHEAFRQEAPIHTIENKRYLLWVVPELEGSIIRFRDKKLGVELLQGYEQYGVRRGTWQDWTNTPGVTEKPVATSYSVVESSDHHLVIEARRDDGLLVRRSMTLAPGSKELEVVLELVNLTDQPLRPAVKIHPEFYDQGGNVPEVWGRKAGEWIRLTEEDEDRASLGEYLPSGDIDGLAFRLTENRLTLACEFDPASVGGLLWYYNTQRNAQQMNLELLPSDEPLAPGQSIVLRGEYYARKKAPKRL